MKKAIIALALILATYLFLAGQQLNLPGLHNDEAQEAGLPALQITRKVPVSAFRDVGIGSRRLPIMVQDYIGALHVYITLPFVAALGPTTISVRLPSLLIGAITVMLTFGFTYSAWGKNTALLAAGLLALHPSFVFWSRQGTLVASVTLAFAMALLWVTVEWCKFGNARTALAAGLLAGAGVYSKILFLWIIGGMAGTAVLINLPGLLRLKFTSWPRRITLMSVLSAMAGFSVGVAPILVFHMLSHGDALTIAGKMFSANTSGWGQIRGSLDHFGAVLTGKNHFWYLGSSPGNPLWLWAFAFSTLAIISQAILGMRHARRGLALFLLLVLALLIAPFTPTPAGLFPHHLAIFAPLWTTLVAVGTGSIMQIIKETICQKQQLRLAFIPIALGVTTLAAGDITTNLHMHRELAKGGGEGPHSEAIQTLVERLQLLQPTQTVALDWGISPQVRYLSSERIAPTEIFGYGPTADTSFGERLQPFFQLPETVYLLHTPKETIFQRRTEFKLEADKQGYELQQIDVVRKRSGVPIFEMFVVRKQ